MKFHTLLQAYEKHLHKIGHHGLLVAGLSIFGISLVFSYQALSNSSHARYIKSTLQTVSNRLAPNPALDEVPRPLTGIILDDEPVGTGSTGFDNTIRYLDEIRCNRTGTSTNPIVFLNRTVSSIPSPATRIEIYHSPSPDVQGPLNLMGTPLISDRYFMMTMSSRDYQLFRLKTVDNYGNQVGQEMQYICKDDHFVGTPANTGIILTGGFDLSITKRYVGYTQVPLGPLGYQFEITIVNNGPSVSQSFVFIDDLLQSNLKREAGSYGSMGGDTTCIFPSPNTRENVQCNIGALQPGEHRYITLYANPLNNNGNYCTNIAYIITNDSNNSNNYSKVNFNCDSSVIQTGVVINNTGIIYGYGYGYQPGYGYGYGYGYMGGRYGANKPYFYLTKPYLMISEKIYKKFKDIYTTGIKKLSKTALVRLFDKKTLRTMKRDVELYLTKQIQFIASSKALTVSQRLEQLRRFATYKGQAQVQYKELIDKK